MLLFLSTILVTSKFLAIVASLGPLLVDVNRERDTTSNRDAASDRDTTSNRGVSTLCIALVL